MTVYKSYAKAVGLKFCLIIAAAFLVFTAITIVNNYWLSLWSDDAKCERTTQTNQSQSAGQKCGEPIGVRLGVYVGLGLFQGTSVKTFLRF